MEIYKQYADVQKQIDALEEQKEALRAQITEVLPDDGFKDENVNAFWTKKTKWEYSETVKSLEMNLKSTKKKEEEDGTAKGEEVKQLTIKVI